MIVLAKDVFAALLSASSNGCMSRRKAVRSGLVANRRCVSAARAASEIEWLEDDAVCMFPDELAASCGMLTLVPWMTS